MVKKTCKKCGIKSRTKTRKNKRTRKNRKYRLYKVGGGCGCGNNDVKPWLGGENQVPNDNVVSQIPYNDSANDPNNSIMSSRNMPDIVSTANGVYMKGGKRRSNKRTKRTKRIQKMSGGDALLGSNPNMPIMSFGTTSGAYDFYDTMKGTNQVNPAPYVQPVLKMYGDHNYPLV